MENNGKVDIYMASLWRGGHCVKTIESLRHQPEFGSLSITCNNYTKEQLTEVLSTPTFQDTRVKVYVDKNAKRSNEKLRFIHKGVNKYIMLADDDIIYPGDYLSKLIAGCERYKAMVGLHGVILAPGVIRSYYKDRMVFRGLGAVEKDVRVDIASNCGSLWRRDFFTDYSEWYNQVSNVSADDIYVAIFMKSKGIPRWVLAHEEGYITHKPQEPGDNYVFDEYALKPGADAFQTMLINKQYKNLK